MNYNIYLIIISIIVVLIIVLFYKKRRDSLDLKKKNKDNKPDDIYPLW